MRPRGGRAGRGAGTVPHTAWDGAARLHPRKQRLHPKTSSSSSSSPWGTSSPISPREGQRPAMPVFPGPLGWQTTQDPPAAAGRGGSEVGAGLPAGAPSRAGAKAGVGKAVPGESGLMGCRRPLGGRLRRRKAMCLLFGGFLSSFLLSYLFPPCPRECGRTQDHAGSDAAFTGLEAAMEGSRGVARPGGWSGRSPSLLPVPPAGPILRTSLRSASPGAGASPLRWLGVPREGVRTPRRSGRSRREGHGEGCLAAGEGLKRNYSLHKNIHSSQGP